MYKGLWCVILYSLALVMLLSGAYWHVNCTVYVMAGLFFGWDIWFVGGEHFEGRTTTKILSHCRDAETLMSYFIGFYAAVLAVVFTDTGKTTTFLKACHQAHLSMCFVGAPLVLAAIPMLFIPVEFGKKKDEAAHQKEDITRSVKALMFVNIYFEKLVVFTFVHDLLRISMALVKLSEW